MENTLIEVKSVKKHYQRGAESVAALRGIDLKINKGEFVAIMGPSGSGKSTLLQLLGALDVVSEGEIFFKGDSLSGMSDNDLSLFRRRHLGFIFQFFNLIPTMTAFENVILPIVLDGQLSSEAKNRAKELLAKVGLSDRADHYPAQLSGGQMQRVAIARALIAKPLLILADEPTGSLDSKTGTEVMQILSDLVKTEKQTIVMVTHDSKTTSWASRTITIKDGLIESDLPSGK